MSPDEVMIWKGARASLAFFTTKILGLQWNAHYKEWEKLVESGDRILIQAPRGSRKSYFFSLAYPLWRILRAKTEILMVSDSEEQARKNLRIMREFVEDSPSMAPLRPSTKELWGTDQIQFANGSIVNIMGFGTSKRGEHPDLIINDDIESERNKMSRDDKNRMYFAVITGMAISGRTKLITVGTPLDFEDLLDQCEKRKDDLGNPIYKQWKRPALVNGESQFKDIWSSEDLRFKKYDMGAIDFAREMLLERIDPATQPFKRDYETLYDALPERFAYTATVCDPAYTEGDGDYTAIMTVKFTHGNHAYVVEAKRIRKEDPGMIVDEIFKTIRAQNPDAVGLPKKKGEAVSYSFQERRVRENQWNFRYVELPETQGKAHKTRIGGLVPRWESRSIHIHRNMKDLLEEIYQFRLDDTHRHDDMLDALAHCFNPEMAQPNSGSKHIPKSATATSGRPFYYVGTVPKQREVPKTYSQLLMEKMDRRVSDRVAA